MVAHSPPILANEEKATTTIIELLKNVKCKIYLVWESFQKQAHTNLVREHSATVVSGC